MQRPNIQKNLYEKSDSEGEVMSLQGSTPGGRAPKVEIAVGLAFECLLTLNVFHDPKGYAYEVGNEWLEMVRQRATSALLTTIEAFPANWNLWHALLGLAYDSTPPRDVPSFLESLEAIDPLELRLHLLGYYQRSIRRIIPRDIIFRAAQGDSAAQDQYLHIPPSVGDDQRAYARHLFTTDPEATKTTLLTLLHQWYDRVFCPLEQQVLPILERDAEAKRALQATLTPEHLIETATNGLAYLPESGIRTVVLTPSFVMRPWNEHIDYQDLILFCYPVADESLEQERQVPIMRLVRLYQALADERRLRLLKMLATRSYSLQELADAFGIAKTTMHYHLATLRTAGLVLAQPNGKLYSLRREKLAEVSELLDAYLESHHENRFSDGQ